MVPIENRSTSKSSSRGERPHVEFPFGCVYRDKPVSRGEEDYDKRIECGKGEGWYDELGHTREKLLEEETSLNREDGYVRLTVSTIIPIMAMAPTKTMSIFASVPTVRDSRMTVAPTKKTAQAKRPPSGPAAHYVLLDGQLLSDLISPEPTTSHKEKDRQAEANNHKRSINSSEYLFDKQRENSGVDRNQTREGDWEQPTCREQCPHDDDDEAGR